MKCLFIYAKANLKEISKRPLSCHTFSYRPRAFLNREYSPFYVLIKAGCVYVRLSMFCVAYEWWAHTPTAMSHPVRMGAVQAQLPRRHTPTNTHKLARTHLWAKAAVQKYLFYFSPLFVFWQKKYDQYLVAFTNNCKLYIFVTKYFKHSIKLLLFR